LPTGVPIVLKDADSLGMSRKQACRMMLAEPDFRAFADRLAGHVARATGKRVFAEKTPSNIYCARQLLDWTDTHVVELLRHPLDMVNSYVRKGFGLLESVGFWMGAVAAGHVTQGRERCLRVRYEDLRDTPLATMNGLMAQVGLSVYEEALLADPTRNTVDPDYRGRSEAWSRLPGDLSWPMATTGDRNLLVKLPNYRLSPRFANYLGMERMTLAELADLTDYRLETVEPNYRYRWPKPTMTRRQLHWFRRIYGLRVPEILCSE
ncbi:MAG: sulfotransferase, partial [Gallionellaceae bacterium]|nr:sulfotransferase [Gallionellaceae bacterium]